MDTAPTASIVLATYNRSYVLRHAVASVLRSDFSDFELIVVGDGCTDDTEAVVRGFADPRTRFVNLPENSGGQSAPNNAGVALARGRYILFLNHDDFYFPDHVGASVAFMEREQADIATSPVLVLERSGREEGLADLQHDTIVLDGSAPKAGFDPRTFIIASSWIVRADVCRAVGPWLDAGATRLSPSQEWLFRASRQGRQVAHHRHVSVLCIHAGFRQYSYVIRHSPEHERAWTWITGGEAARRALVECAAVEQSARLKTAENELRHYRRQGRFPHLRAFATNTLRRLGVHPIAVDRLIDRQGKGDWIAQVRRFTGEAPRLALGETLDLGSTTSEVHLGRGWHPVETDGRWTSARTAEILISVEDTSCALELLGHPLRIPDEVVFAFNGAPALTHRYDAANTIIRVPVPAVGSFWFTIGVETPTSPSQIRNSADGRTLGFWLSRLRLVPLSG